MKVFIGLVVISILSTGVNAGPVAICDLQKDCISWTMERLNAGVCDPTNACEIKVCMNVNTASPCAKGAADTISHVCDKGGTNDCPVTTWDKKENVGTGSFCQVGIPGESVSFIIKDGSNKTSDIDAHPPFPMDVDECDTDANVTCQQVKAANIGSCGGGQNNVMERVWTITIPDNACECFDSEALEEELGSGTGNINVVYNSGNIGKSYFTATYVKFNQSPQITLTGLQTYCIDLNNTIYSNKDYCARVVSSYDMETLVTLTGIGKEENFDLVNYVLNTYRINKTMTDNASLTGGSIQQVMWRLIFTDNPYPFYPEPNRFGEGNSSAAHVKEILAAANANGQGFKPPCNGTVAVVLYPVTDCNNGGDANNAQVLFAQAQVSLFPTVCNCICPTDTRRRMRAASVVKQQPHWLRG
jgi:hypothetical protein